MKRRMSTSSRPCCSARAAQVLLAPPGWEGESLSDRILIAWNARREAARAVADAMPLLVKARDVVIATIDAVPSDGGHGPAPGKDLAVHLERHGVNVRVNNVDGMGRTAAGALMDEGGRPRRQPYRHGRLWPCARRGMAVGWDNARTHAICPHHRSCSRTELLALGDQVWFCVNDFRRRASSRARARTKALLASPRIGAHGRNTTSAPPTVNRSKTKIGYGGIGSYCARSGDSFIVAALRLF